MNFGQEDTGFWEEQQRGTAAGNDHMPQPFFERKAAEIPCRTWQNRWKNLVAAKEDLELNMKKLSEKAMHLVFLVSACASILAVAMICVFLFANGIPAIGKIGPLKFLLGQKWKPGNNLFGILPMILGSIYVTAGAIVVGVPIGILTAVYMSKFCPKRLYRVIKPAIDLLAGIPSVVYGFFGMVVLVPAMNLVVPAFVKGWNGLVRMLPEVCGFLEMQEKISGKSMATASVLLGIMILPTIIGVSESAINAVPDSYYEGALALGASHERSVFFATLPAAKSGILAGVILGVGRAIGETMAVIMVAGNQPRMPKGLFAGVRTMTANIVMEMGYATDLHREALIATAVVLFVFILIINLSFSVLNRKAA